LFRTRAIPPWGDQVSFGVVEGLYVVAEVSEMILCSVVYGGSANHKWRRKFLVTRGYKLSC